MITPLNTHVVTGRLAQLLRETATISDSKAIIEQGELLNKDPGRCPWVGIYVVGSEFVSRTLGMSAGFRMQQIDLAVVFTESSSVSGFDCEERMEALITSAVGAILSDPSIGGSVILTSDPFRITYADYRQEGNAYFKTAVLQFTVESPVTVS